MFTPHTITPPQLQKLEPTIKPALFGRIQKTPWLTKCFLSGTALLKTVEPPRVKRFCYPIVFSVGAATRIAGYLSASPVHLFGCTPKVTKVNSP